MGAIQFVNHFQRGCTYGFQSLYLLLSVFCVFVPTLRNSEVLTYSNFYLAHHTSTITRWKTILIGFPEYVVMEIKIRGLPYQQIVINTSTSIMHRHVLSFAMKGSFHNFFKLSYLWTRKIVLYQNLFCRIFSVSTTCKLISYFGL